MKYVTLGKTGIVSPKNGFGALPIQRDTTDVAAYLLRKAYDAGFTYFDTARSYSDSEIKIGVALSDVRDKITIATKTASLTPEGILKDLNTSLSNMKTDYIDVYQLHNPSFCPLPGDGSGIYELLSELKQKGVIRHIGITNHRLSVAEQAVRSGFYETLQFPFCYLATQKDIDIVNLCKENNVGFIAMKALSGGLITDSRAAYAWLDQYDNVLPIWGVQRENELDEFISYFDAPPAMTPEITASVERDRRELSGNFCRGCGYCMPCPANIKINDCARMIQLIRRSPSAQWLTPESQKMMLNIENCINCRSCASKCPYGLDTPALLKENLADYKNILSGKTVV